MIIPKEFLSFLLDKGYKFTENEPMKNHTTFKIGGNADLFVTVFSVSQLKDILIKASEYKIPVNVIGNGSNLLVSDNGVDGIIIKIQFDEEVAVNENTVSVTAGVKLSTLCLAALNASLSGLEFAWGIPGTVGGAVFMNAGAYGGEIKDVLLKCKAVDLKGNVFEFTNSEAEFGYRTSIFKSNKFIIISADFELKKAQSDVIKEKMDDLMLRRKTKQPLDMPNAGSVFKRPEGNFAGTLIEQCGLKGCCVGGAQVSEKHAGFIVNNGNASCKDVTDLIEYIIETVFSKNGIMLEQEIAVFGR